MGRCSCDTMAKLYIKLYTLGQLIRELLEEACPSVFGFDLGDVIEFNSVYHGTVYPSFAMSFTRRE